MPIVHDVYLPLKPWAYDAAGVLHELRKAKRSFHAWEAALAARLLNRFFVVMTMFAFTQGALYQHSVHTTPQRVANDPALGNLTAL